MASAGTLLSDLDGQPPASDKDLVQQILADMSVSGTQRSAPPPPPMPAQQPHYQQIPTTISPMTMDSRIPTAHVIGNEHPTPADFAAAMAGMAGARPSEVQLTGAPVGTLPGYSSGVVQTYEPPTKNWYGRLLDELKVPFVVAFLFFVFSLSPVRVLAAQYVPSLVKPTGEFTVLGLSGAALVVGMSFWFLQRVIAPLLSL